MMSGTALIIVLAVRQKTKRAFGAEEGWAGRKVSERTILNATKWWVRLPEVQVELHLQDSQGFS